MSVNSKYAIAGMQVFNIFPCTCLMRKSISDILPVYLFNVIIHAYLHENAY